MTASPNCIARPFRSSSELLGLKWVDVDLVAGLVRVQRQLQRDVSYAEPKMIKGRRAICCGPTG